MKTHFINALENLKIMLGTLTNKAENSLKLAIEATDTNSEELANFVIEKDREIDMLEIAIEEECLKILALYQPVASDLRTIITILKINNELERIGDLAVNIAENAIIISAFEQKDIEKINFNDIVYKVCDMLKVSLDALSFSDIILAGNVIKADDEVDFLHDKNKVKIQNLMVKNHSHISYYSSCYTISCCLERIADMATNIAEDVIYLESGKIVRHSQIGENYGK